MSYNVRYPAKGDGHNRWELREHMFIRSIQMKNPDLIGTQELFYIQGESIVNNLPEYEWFGNSRRGNREDEHMGIFYKRAKLRVIESGNFWLSETPDIAGSQAWGANLPRMVTWALFEVKSTGFRFYFYNTHFHHTAQANEARVNSAKLIASRLASLPSGAPVIVTGDFNAAAPEAEAYTILTANLKDARTTAARSIGPNGTISGFGERSGDRRIDWILYRGPFTVLESETITYNEDGRYPSDHYPILSVLEF
ncbi:MAG: endonuclease/exonuclease/phosphatase family protein [Bryobacterales bacterium]|nr:endonuclease/exonuclease/phosphatase family protein [Bryobacterales bacterium]